MEERIFFLWWLHLLQERRLLAREVRRCAAAPPPTLVVDGIFPERNSNNVVQRRGVTCRAMGREGVGGKHRYFNTESTSTG